MVDFKKLEESCESNSKLLADVVDDFLIPYCAYKTNLPNLADKHLGVYSHITRDHKDWLEMFKSQYIVHHIFKKGGVGRKMVNHSIVKEELNQEELDFFKAQIENPWRFSFSRIIGNPKENFFNMLDMFTGEEFLLYSPGVQDISETENISLWLNLIQYNGSCWQSFGPIGSYRSFDADDIYFFATEVDPSIESDDDLIVHIEKNPAPYMMLFSGSRYPQIQSRGHLTKHHRSIYEVVQLDFKKLKEYFEIESNSNIHRFRYSELHQHPHFACSYYIEQTKELIIEAMTEYGFDQIIDQWSEAGYDLTPFPELSVSPSMLTTAQKITRKKFNISPYEAYFDHDTEEDKDDNKRKASQAEIDKINGFMQLAMPILNSGQKPDIAKLAKQANIDESMARDLFEQLSEQLTKMKNNIKDR